MLAPIYRLLQAQMVCFSRYGEAAITVLTVMGWERTSGTEGLSAMVSDYEAAMLTKNRRESHPMVQTHFTTGEYGCSVLVHRPCIYFFIHGFDC